MVATRSTYQIFFDLRIWKQGDRVNNSFNKSLKFSLNSHIA